MNTLVLYISIVAAVLLLAALGGWRSYRKYLKIEAEIKAAYADAMAKIQAGCGPSQLYQPPTSQEIPPLDADYDENLYDFDNDRGPETPLSVNLQPVCDTSPIYYFAPITGTLYAFDADYPSGIVTYGVPVDLEAAAERIMKGGLIGYVPLMDRKSPLGKWATTLRRNIGMRYTRADVKEQNALMAKG